MWLIIKILRETYDNELTRLQRKMGKNLTPEQKVEYLKTAKKAICQTGVSMYRFTQIFKSRYQRVVENDAMHQAIERGIQNDLLQWSEPRRIDYSDSGIELRNVTLTEKGFQALNQPGFDLAITTIHTSYIEKMRGK
jgi:hypothetical protein